MCLPGLNALSFDPAANNDPLQFNGSSGPVGPECPPLENASENSKKRKRASLPPGTDGSSHTGRALCYMFFFNINYQKLCSSCVKYVQLHASGSGVEGAGGVLFFPVCVYWLISLPWHEARLSCREVRWQQQETEHPTVAMLTTPTHQNC